jgi:hypothetical protein
MGGRWLAWWRVAEAAAATLAHPVVDRDGADADVYAVAVGSRLLGAARGAAAAMHRAWTHSRVGRAIEDVRGETRARSVAERIRVGARCMLIASVTVLVLLGAGTSSGRRYEAIVPLVAGLLALGAAVAAEPLARAWRGKRT